MSVGRTECPRGCGWASSGQPARLPDAEQVARHDDPARCLHHPDRPVWFPGQTPAWRYPYRKEASVKWTCQRGCGAEATAPADDLPAIAAVHDRVCPNNPAAAEHRTPLLAALGQWRARAQVIRNNGGRMILAPIEVLEALLDQATLVEGLVAQCREVIELTEPPTVAMVRAETIVRRLGA